MSKDGNFLVLTQAFDRLKACAEGRQTKVCLTSKECEKVCAYIWWLTDRCAKAEGKPDEVEQGFTRQDRLVFQTVKAEVSGLLGH